MTLKVIEDFIPLGHPNRPGTKLYGLKARVWHSTANLNAGANDTMHKGYMGRAYKKVWNASKGKYEYFEADGKTEFRYGGAHVFIDKDSATITAPLDEVVWGCGDRPLDYNNGYKGQTKLAKEVFNNQNNYYTWNIELCMNDMAAWDKVLANAIEFVKTYMPGVNLRDYRHYDMTGKSCPSPMVCKPGSKEEAGWISFGDKIKQALAVKDPLEQAVKVLQDNGIIGTPGYWLENARKGKAVNGEYAGTVIMRTAEKLKGSAK